MIKCQLSIIWEGKRWIKFIEKWPASGSQIQIKLFLSVLWRESAVFWIDVRLNLILVKSSHNFLTRNEFPMAYVQTFPRPLSPSLAKSPKTFFPISLFPCLHNRCRRRDSFFPGERKRERGAATNKPLDGFASSDFLGAAGAVAYAACIHPSRSLALALAGSAEWEANERRYSVIYSRPLGSPISS